MDAPIKNQEFNRDAQDQFLDSEGKGSRTGFDE